MSEQNFTHPDNIAWYARWRIGQRVWQLCSAREALLLFLIPIAIALTATYLLPQAPAQLYADNLQYQEWLSARQVAFKNWTPLLTSIGAFHIRQTLWFRSLLTLLAFVLLISLGEQLRLLLSPVLVRKPAPFYNSTDATSIVSDLSYDEALRKIRNVFQWRLVQSEGPGTAYLYGGRHTWARASTAVIYLGLFGVVSGLALQARVGWWQSGIQVLPYEDVALGPGGTLQLRLLDIQPAHQDQDTQPVPVAKLQIAGQTVLFVELGVPIHHRGYRYLWVSRGGPSVRLSAFRVSDSEHALTLYDYAVSPLKADALQFSFASGQDPDRQFILSEDKVVGWLRWETTERSASEDRQTFQLWLFGEDGQELGRETFEQVESEQDTTVQQAVIGDVLYRLEVARYIVLDIAYQPGQWLLWLGGVLLALGSLGKLVPQTRIWAQVSQETGQIVVKVRDQTEGLLGTRDNASRLIARLRSALETSNSFEHAAAQPQAEDLSPEQTDTRHRND